MRELRHYPPLPGLVALPCNEITRLLGELLKTEHGRKHVLGWSVFRRAHQARAQQLHYRGQAILES